MEGKSSPLTSPYAPIDPASDTIRLLRLEGDRTGIHGSLIHCSLSNAPKYTALSYAWGSPESPSEIKINGLPVSIRRNLWEALKAIQSINFQPRRDDVEEVMGMLWVDSVCIDQNNTAEKNHQVQQMAAIYSTAAMVISWLGPHTLDSTMLFEWGNNLKTPPPWDWNDTDNETGNGVRKAIKQLLERDYWHRLWIVQEVLLSRHDHQLLCGTDSVSGYGFFNQWLGGGTLRCSFQFDI
ncbi:heterokaryon incompatibility protein-domain-containing protein [Podospora aff. communis PSN243]|uniref:Heterokaryon incompatibility protein-domain-containing protein n=1 Tax=Podospora aff. communis PSN243 TaxID=3040156 RepID=A0AAV9GE63_9PEZI|nr:heterokaryon incompatibility protein-domain-containing protein [Podospora aff. communis PSN243]